VASDGKLEVAVKREEGKRLKEALSALEAECEAARVAAEGAALSLPCDTHPAAPVGPEEAAVEVARVGTLPTFDFVPADHITLGTRLGLFDLTAGPAIAGTGFMVFTGDGVLLQQALVSWALSRAAAAGFTPVAPPDVAHTALVEGCGFNPRDATDAGGGVAASSQVYSLRNSDLCLIGTSEISLAGLHAGAIMDAATLPAAYCAVSHCFRREAGAHGQRDKGLYRLHQFTKVELFAYVVPDAPLPPLPPTALAPPVAIRLPATPPAASPALPPPATLPAPASEAMFERLVNLQVAMMAELGLHFRVLDMPSEELGAAAYRKVDLEAWMPCRTGTGAFGEITSASNCTDYQARRLGIRYRAKPGDNRFVHTLNATACAVPRIILALLETHQRADGSVALPPALVPFMGGRTHLTPPPRKA